MGMVVVIAILFGCFHAAIEIVRFAASSIVSIALELNGSMANMIFIAEQVGEGLQDG